MSFKHSISRFSMFALGTAAACASGCSSSDSGTGEPAAASCADPLPSRAPSATEARQSGRIIRALSGKTPIGCATVTVGAETTTTKQDGTYEIVVPRGQAYTMSVKAANHFTLQEQKWTIATDNFLRGDTNMLDRNTADLMSAFLEKRDPQKGTLAVSVIALPPCATVDGATLQVDPPGSARLSYFAEGLPSTSATSVKAGEAFSGAFYNIDVGTPVNVKVTSPSCKPVAFPVDYQGVTYSGEQSTQAGEYLAFLRVFIQ